MAVIYNFRKQRAKFLVEGLFTHSIQISLVGERLAAPELKMIFGSVFLEEQAYFLPAEV